MKDFMEWSAPEEQGISSSGILAYVSALEQARLSTHDIILMRNGRIVFEAYWEPFHRDFLHRMYSVSKSVTALAIGFLEQDGKLRLDDPIGMYFPEEISRQPDENMRRQTVRDTLMMCTAKSPQDWFLARTQDRVRFYFENDKVFSRLPGQTFEYDSTGSFVLCALAERLAGMPMMEYLRGKLLDRIGVSEKAYMLKCPGGHSWGDSGLLCTPRDLLRIAAFVMNRGEWDGEQLLNEAFLREAVSALTDNDVRNENRYNTQGYGYSIWRTYDNSFSFNGMGSQFAVCVPDKDMILIYNGDNQGKEYANALIFDRFFEMIVRPAQDVPLPPDEAARRALAEYAAGRKLAAAVGEADSPLSGRVSGCTWRCQENPMGLTWVRLSLDGDRGVFSYTNAQGEKALPFGLCRNEFSLFPQDGYSDETGSVPSDVRYRCAASGAWTAPDTLLLKVQIIDRYMGVLHIQFRFREDRLGIFMTKTAEDFLNEYQGFAGAWKQEQTF